MLLRQREHRRDLRGGDGRCGGGERGGEEVRGSGDIALGPYLQHQFHQYLQRLQ